jgi:hypothetical protein
MGTADHVPGRYWFRPVVGWEFVYSGKQVYEAWQIGDQYSIDVCRGHSLVVSDPAAALKNTDWYKHLIRKAS